MGEAVIETELDMAGVAEDIVDVILHGVLQGIVPVKRISKALAKGILFS